MSHLFDRLQIGNVTLKNRIAVSPMCQYSSDDGAATDWHLVHLGSRAVGGAALIMVEATAIEPAGRVSPCDMGIWDDKHIAPFKRITSFIESQNSVPAIQIAHAGRKAGTRKPWAGRGPLTDDEGGWQPVGASPIPFADNYRIPCELDCAGIKDIVAKFRQAAGRAVSAGFKIIEIHAAHGYLLHSFLSPLSNQRTDAYGGSLENRMRLLIEVTDSVRKEIPDNMPLFVRISATDWVEGGWDIEQSVLLAGLLKKLGVDLIDCSSGALVPYERITPFSGYQVEFAETIKKKSGILTGAVGMITEALQADEIIARKKADLVFLARELLRNPYWPLHSAKLLKADTEWPVQYERAKN